MPATDPSLHELAQAAGLQLHWHDITETECTLSDDRILLLMDALDFPVRTSNQRKETWHRLQQAGTATPKLITTEASKPLTLPFRVGSRQEIALTDQYGIRHPVKLTPAHQLIAPAGFGYYTLESGQHVITLAVAPSRCYGITDALGTQRPHTWGLAVQVYGLHSKQERYTQGHTGSIGDGGIGNAASVAQLAEHIGHMGGQALALSPLHAGPPMTEHYSPYSPSDRVFLDWRLAAPQSVLGQTALEHTLTTQGLMQQWQQQQETPVIDWPTFSLTHWRVMEVLFHQFHAAETALQQRYHDFVTKGDRALQQFATLAAQQKPPYVYDAALNVDPIGLEYFAQWVTVESWQQACKQAKHANLGLGFITDLAVGFDCRGSEAQRNKHLLLKGMSIGSPPDDFNQHGQCWNLTSYSPLGLLQSGYQAYIDLLRANMKFGGLRIDHILGLNRLWIIPHGEHADCGGYLHYPQQDLMRLIALESWLNRCIVIGEDLGTVPAGLRDKLAQCNFMGMDVLLFNRDKQGNFLSPSKWRDNAVAYTTTHDTATLKGWREGHDIGWRARIEAWPNQVLQDAREQRARDVTKLDQALDKTGIAPLDTQTDKDEHPSPELRAICYVAKSPAPLVLLPLEDALGLVEQPNLPGTIAEHPNWQRRLSPQSSPLLDTALEYMAKERRNITQS